MDRGTGERAQCRRQAGEGQAESNGHKVRARAGGLCCVISRPTPTCLCLSNCFPQAFACLLRLYEATAGAVPGADQQPDLAAVEDRCWRMHLSRSDLPYAALQVGGGRDHAVGSH